MTPDPVIYHEMVTASAAAGHRIRPWPDPHPLRFLDDRLPA